MPRAASAPSTRRSTARPSCAGSRRATALRPGLPRLHRQRPGDRHGRLRQRLPARPRRPSRPSASPRATRALAAGDVAFLARNDALQHLGNVGFRAPVPAYKHAAAQFLHITGALASDAHPPARAAPPGVGPRPAARLRARARASRGRSGGRVPRARRTPPRLIGRICRRRPETARRLLRDEPSCPPRPTRQTEVPHEQRGFDSIQHVSRAARPGTATGAAERLGRRQRAADRGLRRGSDRDHQRRRRLGARLPGRPRAADRDAAVRSRRDRARGARAAVGRRRGRLHRRSRGGRRAGATAGRGGRGRDQPRGWQRHRRSCCARRSRRRSAAPSAPASTCS